MEKKQTYKCVMGCKDYAHLFRATNTETELWRQRLNLNELLNYQRVCNKHFSEEMFANQKQMRLTKTALPDINLVMLEVSNENAMVGPPLDIAFGVAEEPFRPYNAEGAGVTVDSSLRKLKEKEVSQKLKYIPEHQNKKGQIRI